jgi:mono/diheme cytochrome c family protein
LNLRSLCDPRLKEFSMKILVVIFLFATPLLAQHAFTPEEIAEGARMYQSNCTGCHGTAGDLVPGVSLMSGKFRRATSDDEAAGIIRKGVPGTAMQAFNFTEQQAGMIVAYLKSFSGGSAALGPDSGATGDAARGKQIFEGKGACLTCHRVGENGSRVGPDLSSAGLPRPPLARFVGFGAPPPPPTPATIRAQLQRDLTDPDSEIAPNNRMFRAVQRDGSVTTGRLLNLDPFNVQLFDSKERLVTFERSQLREFAPVKSAMPSYRDKLTAQELSDLVAYLASLKGQVQ